MGLIADLFAMVSRPGKIRSVEGSIYDFKIKSIDGKEISFDRFKGKHVLIVNTASKCAFTPQYSELEDLHLKYGQYVVIVGFPANNFLWQEPGSNEEIGLFCQKNYGVTFSMVEKISVKGKDQHPIYKWLEAKTGKIPTWNFCKYLISKDGKDVKFYPSKISPLAPDILDEILK